MPGWHEKTKGLVAEGKLKVLGVVEEQHPDRAALFMKWHQMDWPVVSDPLNLLGVYAIPYTFLIDEHGFIRYRNPKPADLEQFLATDYEPISGVDAPSLEAEAGTAEHMLMWGKPDSIETAIQQLEKRTMSNPQDAKTLFRLGVAYRMRYDSDRRQPSDFAKAAELQHATHAVDGDNRPHFEAGRIHVDQQETDALLWLHIRVGAAG